jgi:hypothetical protein
MRPYEIQDEHSDNEQERVHARSVSTDVTAKPVSARAAKRVKCAKVEQVHDGGLGKANLVKLNGTIKKMRDESRTMEELLIYAARHSTTISPKLVTQLASVKSGLEAELAAMQLYKENNREEDTAEHCKNALAQLAAARNNFKVLEKILSAVK